MPQRIEAIDVHAHFGECKGPSSKLVCAFTSGDALRVVQMARLSNIRKTMVSPLLALLPRNGGDPVAGNHLAEMEVAKNEALLQWVVVDPLKKATYSQAVAMLKNPKCVGIKIHPEEHVYPITQYGRELFTFAAENHAIIQMHSGEKNSMPEDVVALADEFPEVKVIVSHLGCGWDGDPSHQVRAIQRCRHGNIFTDTSSAQNIKPRLIEWAVKEVGAEKILFGTDSILYFAPMQRCRIDYAEISVEDKRKILYDNAVALFGSAGKIID